MKNPGHVKIIVPCTVESEWPRVTVDSILRNTDHPSYEIVLTASVDLDLSFASRYDRVTVLRSEEALSAGEAKNVAASPGDATYYAFLDAHCLVEQRDWLRRATETLAQYPKAATVHPQIVAFAKDNEIGPDDEVTSADVHMLCCEYGEKWAWPYSRPWHLNETMNAERIPDPFEVMAGGAVVITHAEVFHHLGKFDSEVDGQFQDTLDYCTRGWMLGYPTMVDPQIQVHHLHGAPGQPNSMLPLIHGRLRTAYKYLSPRRRDMAEIFFRQHGFDDEVDEALKRVRCGNWLAERVAHLRERVHDDDWLFSKFEVYEERFAGQPSPATAYPAPSDSSR